jgi:short-subunit dehydrogenase
MTDSSDLLQKYGPWALVTGAAQGIGAEFAEQLAAAGLSLVLVDVEEQKLRSRCDALRARHAVEVRPVGLDLRREDLLDALLPEIAGLEVGLLVNNAGIAKIGPFLPQEQGFLLDQLHVNTRAVLLLTHALGREMQQRRRGGIIVVSSGAAWVGTTWNANYAASKAWGLVFAESLWAELGPGGVDVLGFMPTSTDTEMLWQNTPRAPKSSVMSVEACVGEALHALGRHPSWFAGTTPRVAHRLLRMFLPRKTLIRFVGRSLRAMAGDPAKPGAAG